MPFYFLNFDLMIFLFIPNTLKINIVVTFELTIS